MEARIWNAAFSHVSPVNECHSALVCCQGTQRAAFKSVHGEGMWKRSQRQWSSKGTRENEKCSFRQFTTTAEESEPSVSSHGGATGECHRATEHSSQGWTRIPCFALSIPLLTFLTRQIKENIFDREWGPLPKKVSLVLYIPPFQIKKDLFNLGACMYVCVPYVCLISHGI